MPWILAGGSLKIPQLLQGFSAVMPKTSSRAVTLSPPLCHKICK
jgi:hypothetical protein